jgi:hypothetical protein
MSSDPEDSFSVKIETAATAAAQTEIDLWVL